MNKKIYNYFQLIFILPIFITISSIMSGEITVGGVNPFSDFDLHGLQNVIYTTKDNRLELNKNKYTSTELFLDFENEKAIELEDKNHNYAIFNSFYAVVDSPTYRGMRYASFSAKNSSITINPNKLQLLNSPHITDPFYISFFVIPGELEKNSILFSKMYITSGKKYGIECKIIDKIIHVYIINMFHSKNNTHYSYTLSSSDKLKSRDWTHVVVSIDPSSGTGYLIEDKVVKSKFRTIKDESESSDMIFGFHQNDSTPLFIGKTYYGMLDNFLVAKGEVDFSTLSISYKKVNYDSNIKIANHPFGTALSEVKNTLYSNSTPQTIQTEAGIPEGSYVELYFRTSDSLFEKTDEYPEWKSITLNTNFAKDKEFNNKKFKYFQVKFILRSDFEGKFSPSIKKLKFNYLESSPPASPTGLKILVKKVDEANSLKTCLEWNSNHEEDVKKNGGYIIHYGVSPDRMVASIYYDSNGKKITGLESGEPNEINYKNLSHCIDNQLISLNAQLSKDKNLLVFKPGITYYFKISAYNDKFNFTTSIDQKSNPSNSVSITFPYNIKE